MGFITGIFKPSNVIFMKRIFYSGRFVAVGTSKPLDVLWNKGYYCRSLQTNTTLMFGNTSHNGIHQQPRNRQIRAQSVLLIDSEGEKIGTMSLNDAINKAKESSLHVVQIQRQGPSPAICKLVSSKMLYESEKKAKHTTQGAKTKELKITGRIAPQDLQWKSKKIYDFLEHGCLVKLSITRKPYHKISTSEKLEIIKQIQEEVKDVGILDGEPKQMGALVLNCKFKPVVHKNKSKSF